MAGKSEGVKETPQQAALVEKARAQYNDYKARWLPLQQRMASQIEDLGKADSADRMRAKGRANVETQAKFSQARGAVEKSLTNSGRGPGSAAFNLGVTGLAEDTATSRGAGMAGADQAIDNAYIQGLGALTAIGRGEKATAMQGETQLAAMSGRQAAADAQASAEVRAGNMQLAGMVAGYGLNASMNQTKPGAWQQTPANATTTPNYSEIPGGAVNTQGFAF